MRRSERRNNLQICPRRDSNTGGSDQWSSTLPLDHRGAPARLLICLICLHNPQIACMRFSDPDILFCTGWVKWHDFSLVLYLVCWVTRDVVAILCTMAAEVFKYLEIISIPTLHTLGPPPYTVCMLKTWPVVYQGLVTSDFIKLLSVDQCSLHRVFAESRKHLLSS